ncbi:MAG: tRNA preQ1(34) S-adenosylmethionine ribosyltransferase-isomerase QueA [Alphaproteobacteria bacterium]|nr:tRNA preQ1(34) S-adenosylmethionine ribosyltransferase-isomerase QueA [Alphaproteobacteria bacterium]
MLNPTPPLDPTRLESYDYPLPAELIASRPMVPREAARLLRITQAGVADHRVADLPDLLQPGDLLVVNDTRVIPARLHGQRDQVPIEVQLHRQTGPDGWLAFAKPGKRLRVGHTITFDAGLSAAVLAKEEGGVIALRFNQAGAALTQAIATIGTMPLPPYIKRLADAQDRQDYQTVFATHDGSVAAPTAGLHLTPALLDQLAARGVGLARVTLHVGAGTFLPVKVDDIRDHRMHSEWGAIGPEAAAALAAAQREGRAIIPVGTTALRVLEAAAAAGPIAQPFSGEIDLFIHPGYRFQVVDRLMTNFHLPKSTLVMLVSALAGIARVRAAYAHAIAQRYRFFSYGDACLIDRIEP